MAAEIALAQPVQNGKGAGVPEFVNVAERVNYLDGVFSGEIPANGAEVTPDDPEFQRQMMRPAGIKEDVKLMEQRGRVNFILRSNFFRYNDLLYLNIISFNGFNFFNSLHSDELEQIIDEQIRSGNAPGALLILEQLSDALRLPFVTQIQEPTSPPLSTGIRI